MIGTAALSLKGFCAGHFHHIPRYAELFHLFQDRIDDSDGAAVSIVIHDLHVHTIFRSTEDLDRGVAVDLELFPDALFCGCIDPANDNTISSELLGDFLPCWSELLAVAAPRSGEGHNRETGVLRHLLSEGCGSHLKHRASFRFGSATATAAGFGVATSCVACPAMLLRSRIPIGMLVVTGTIAQRFQGNLHDILHEILRLHRSLVPFCVLAIATVQVRG
mmetsp:Transcript_11940/g.32854  ORF Transcript_11940/g.32854 Transcript_11940/m.32854 type:complete len:220 (-) Transcript_11940:485-1144(-)